jgi:hypothetical protein
MLICGVSDISIYLGCCAWCNISDQVRCKQAWLEPSTLGSRLYYQRYHNRLGKHALCSTSGETRDAAGNTHPANITSSRELLLRRVTSGSHPCNMSWFQMERIRLLTQHGVVLSCAMFLFFFHSSFVCLSVLKCVSNSNLNMSVTAVPVCPHIISSESFLSIYMRKFVWTYFINHYFNNSNMVAHSLQVIVSLYDYISLKVYGTFVSFCVK